MIEVIRSRHRDRRWTVALVNWKSIDFIVYQLKQLYEHNDPCSFTLSIFDATFPKHQIAELLEISAPYRNHENISLLGWTKREERGRPHGAELDRIMRVAESEYFLSNDPDFFWVRGNHLGLLEDVMQACRSCGTAQIVSPKHIPAWCAAYRLEDIKHTSWEPIHGRDSENRVVVVDGRDTGWMPSEATGDQPRLIFETCPFMPPFLGPVSYAGNQLTCMSYQHCGCVLGTHMFRGKYILEPTSKPTPDAWRVGRSVLGKYYLELARRFVYAKGE
jgi:hypothetical protein